MVWHASHWNEQNHKLHYRPCCFNNNNFPFYVYTYIDRNTWLHTAQNTQSHKLEPTTSEDYAARAAAAASQTTKTPTATMKNIIKTRNLSHKYWHHVNEYMKGRPLTIRMDRLIKNVTIADVFTCVTYMASARQMLLIRIFTGTVSVHAIFVMPVIIAVLGTFECLCEYNVFISLLFHFDSYFWKGKKRGRFQYYQ